jgi:hypothetical protein
MGDFPTELREYGVRLYAGRRSVAWRGRQGKFSNHMLAALP